jgi:iron(III) transport system permease protein
LRKREATVSIASVTGRAGFGAAKVSSDAISIRIGIGLLVVWLFVTIAMPLWSLLSKSFENSDGQFVGLANFVTYFSTPTLFNSIFNSLWVALLATAIVIPLAFGYAYALTRS